MDLKSSIKAMSAEQRRELAISIRRDPELYHAVNGMGGLSERADYGLLQGTITKKTVPVYRVEVIAKAGSGAEFKALTNQYGFYKLNLAEGNYTLSVTVDGETKTSEAIIAKGKTSIFSVEFDK